MQLNLNNIKRSIGVFYYYLTELKNKLGNIYIDFILLLFFYLLIFTYVIYAAFHTFFFLISNFNIHVTKNAIPKVLEFSEELFLYLSPIFVLYGFIGYYNQRLKAIVKPDKNEKSEDSSNTSNTFFIAKKLFLSSVLSFVILKIIELLFYPTNELSIEKSIQICVFLIFLIIIVLYQNKDHD